MAGKRRIDRVTDPDLAGRAGTLETAELRALRDDCREEESRLSYTRRLLHARLDIARAEVGRRGGDEQELLSRLPEILSEHGGTSRGARSLRVYQPDDDQPGRRSDDRAFDESALSRLPELDDAELDELMTRLMALERQVSDQRAQVLANLDVLQAELVARYRDGRARIDEVLSSNSDS